MDTSHKRSTVVDKKPSLKIDGSNSQAKAHIGEAANHLLNEGKKLAHEVYEDGLNRLEETQDGIKDYSDQLVQKVKGNPLTSLLIAGGVGFLLSILLKNK